MLDFAYIALSSTLTLVLRGRGHYGYTDLKNQALLLLSALHLAASLALSDLSFELSAPLAAFLGYLVLLSISACWSDNVEDAVRDLPRWWCLFYFCMVCSRVSPDLVLAALFVPAPFAAAYGLCQQWFRFDPCWDLMRQQRDEVFKKAGRFYSFLGNSNYTAAYLGVAFFAGLHLAASQSLWWLAGLVPVWVGLGFSRCRAAWAAVISGLVAANVMFSASPLLLVLGLIMAMAVGIIGLQRIESTLGRWWYARICVRLWKKRPALGWGPRIFRRRIFDYQAQMNAKDPTILGTLKKPGRNQFPVGKRAHNDWFETLAESGIIGLGLFAAFAGLCLWHAPDPLLAGGILAGAVNALFFYNLRTAATALPFFGLAGLCTGPAWAVPYPVQAAFWVLVLGALVYRMAWTPHKAARHYYQAQTAKAEADCTKHIHRALELDPANNMYQHFAAVVSMPRDPVTALMHLTACLHQNDGQKVAWTLWDQLGRIAYANGAMFLARAAFGMSHHLNPAFAPAVQGLAVTDATLAEMQKSEQALKEAA
jgi:hypothetical protein